MANTNSPQTPKHLKYRGVVYDVGLNFTGTALSVEPFNPALVEHDMRAIAQDLHANAVRIEGEEVERLVFAARAAHELGLSVFFNPWKMHATAEETCTYLSEAARAAEELRVAGVKIVLVVGCEFTIFCKGVFPGETFNERVAWFGQHLSDTGMARASLPSSITEKSHELNRILRSMVDTARAEFAGEITYSAGSWEMVDWSVFDIVGIDYYRRGETSDEYTEGLREFRLGKPLAVMEVGCCTYEGAAARGDGGSVILQGVNPDGSGKFKDDEVPKRSETEQADYVGTQLGLLRDAGVEAVFVFVFSFPSLRKGLGDKDLDLASFSLVKSFPEIDPRSKAIPPWEPKEAFVRVAEFFARDEDAAQIAAAVQ